MKVTELGMDTLIRPLQESNAETPMEVTEFGIVTLVRLLQLERKLADRSYQVGCSIAGDGGGDSDRA